MGSFFTQCALEKFSFLGELGFSGAVISGECVAFNSEKVRVLVTWDERSGELAVGVGLLNSRDPIYSLRDVLAMEGSDAPEAQAPFQVSDEGRLEPFLKELSGDLKAHGMNALEGDRMYFRRLEEFRSQGARKFMDEMHVRQVRRKAELAWTEGRYREAADQYASIEKSLTASEKQRVLIARDKQS
jgi:hypothetical protein